MTHVDMKADAIISSLDLDYVVSSTSMDTHHLDLKQNHLEEKDKGKSNNNNNNNSSNNNIEYSHNRVVSAENPDIESLLSKKIDLVGFRKIMSRRNLFVL